MRVFYNGEECKFDYSFRMFRKWAFVLQLKYVSFENGEWIEINGKMSRDGFLNALR
ncbi:U exon [Bottlenose dolphin adenovirus 1]|uniref:U exon n=1 Tax=Bottlenose dolphin adenovirus 1 TaxID=1714377 RepID=A0A1X7MPT6_9ADEN|nr:U exon [Bottlenose dolphin adenovirus 1]SMG83458.1 U exon [Bottlenose dolphin adenovirus 1]